MTHEELSKTLLPLLGGKENIIAVANCMTRLRLTLVDLRKVDSRVLKQTEGVLGIVEDLNFQIIIGPGKAQKVREAFEIVLKEQGWIAHQTATTEPDNDWQANKNALKAGQKPSKMRNFLKVIGNIFFPLIPAIIAGGLFRGIASLTNQLLIAEVMKNGGTPLQSIVITVQLLNLLGNAFWSYFAIFTGVNAAKQFGATEVLGGMIGAMSIDPLVNTIANSFNGVFGDLVIYNAQTPLQSLLISGKGGVIGVIFGVYLLSIIEKRLRKIIPDVLDLVLTGFLAILITGILMLFAVMPLAGLFSDILIKGLSYLINSPYTIVNVISGYVLAALFLPMVLLGLHHGLIPIYDIQLQQLGYVTLFPVLAMAGAGQVGATIAIYLKARQVRNFRMQKIITGALPAGFLGVGEPLIYGVTLPLGKSFITAGLGAGFGGAWIMLTQVGTTAWGPSGLVGLPLTKDPSSFVNYFIGLLIAYLMGFIITMIALKKEDVANV
ncbi:PTS transporter subunit EIIC [Entomospira culicis]|uniref:PTS system N-acetylmuramic acid-specific EIIBC component n=1 Tax=Entomospira culicis TaxID=2719989 RepID=A0A968GDN4_9SPIO|nr:PTS transporter subunit EIIC [Entomospira culicis]NIZ18480.1 PTS transporter subunit EIIC [Entomospira culicis]NIZ68696.1 PTS transporter subunit EIIC [Entomospira culicis]WDI37295.1 PTS transporter subunit EIIC [Entomospira culicis]WDI38924.1 PTS transporter subunit EIIC [Entomospira culicis]